MATRKIEAKLSVCYQVLVQDDSGQPFNTRVNENYNNAGTPQAVVPTQDQDSTTLIIPPTSTKTVDVSNLGAIDYVYLKGDAAFTVKFGAADVIPVKGIFVKDGALPAGVTTVVIGNTSATPLNVTYSFLGH